MLSTRIIIDCAAQSSLVVTGVTTDLMTADDSSMMVHLQNIVGCNVTMRHRSISTNLRHTRPVRRVAYGELNEIPALDGGRREFYHERTAGTNFTCGNTFPVNY